MSDELKDDKKCCKKLAAAGIITALVLSVLSFLMSGWALLAVNDVVPSISSGAGAPISKKYDRGQSMQKALKKKKPVIVFFYTDWCGYCQRFAPTFDKVVKSKDIKKKFAIAYINCEDQNNQEYIQQYQIQGFPTVYVVSADGKDKKLIENSKLFAPDAESELKDDFLDFLESDDKGDKGDNDKKKDKD